jgi:hypothetical protein
MGKRGIGALLGTGLLAMALAGPATAAPVYTITVTKDAAPASVPADGGDVTFTVHVHADSGDFHTVNVADLMAGCSLSAPTGDTGSDGVLSQGETWDYTCAVTDVSPNTENTASATACHNSSPNCNQDSHDATDSGNVTVGLCDSDCALPTEAPPSAEPTAAPTTGTGDQTNVPSQAPTDATGTRSSAPSDAAWLLVVALGLLFGSLVVLRPAGSAKTRR